MDLKVKRSRPNFILASSIPTRKTSTQIMSPSAGFQICRVIQSIGK